MRLQASSTGARGNGGVLAQAGQHRTRPGQSVTWLAQRRRMAVLGASAALTPLLGLAALRQGLQSAPDVIWWRDGRRGLWRLFDACCSAETTGILDFYHAVQPLTTVWAYRDRHRDHIDSAMYKTLGLPLGSGRGKVPASGSSNNASTESGCGGVRRVSTA